MKDSIWLPGFRWAIILLALLLAAFPMLARAADDGDTIDYRFRQGETLIGLAQQYLTEPAAYREIQRINRIPDARRIPVGKVVKFPIALLRKKPARLVVAGFSGPVQLKSGTQAITVEKGAAVPEGTVVTTGRSGFISFSGHAGSTISIPSQSNIRILRARRYLINNGLDVDVQILNGRSSFQPPKLDPADRYRVRTPVAVSAVRGTTFRVFYEEEQGRAGTGVIEGTVKLQGNAEARDLEQGFGAVASAAGLAPSERLLASPQVLNPGKVQTEEAVSFALTPIADSKGYRTQIASDAGFIDVLAEEVSASPVAEFTNVPNGTLFVRSRAIAQSGIEGFSDAFSFRRQRLGVTATAERDPLGDGFKFAWEQQGEGEAMFNFRLWREGNEALPLVAEIGMSDTTIALTRMPPGVYYWQVGAVVVADGDVVEASGPAQKLTVSD